MFISINSGSNGWSVCFAITRISYVPASGIKIYGEDDVFLQVMPTGDIVTNDSVPIGRCELPGWSFSKYFGKPIDDDRIINVDGISDHFATTMEGLYDILKSDLFSE